MTIEMSHFVGLKFYVIHSSTSVCPDGNDVFSFLKFKSFIMNSCSALSMRNIMLIIGFLATNSLFILNFVPLDEYGFPFLIPTFPKSYFFHLCNLVVTLTVYFYKQLVIIKVNITTWLPSLSTKSFCLSNLIPIVLQKLLIFFRF